MNFFGDPWLPETLSCNETVSSVSIPVLTSSFNSIVAADGDSSLICVAGSELGSKFGSELSWCDFHVPIWLLSHLI